MRRNIRILLEDLLLPRNGHHRHHSLVMLHHAPYILHPTPYTVHPTSSPYTLHPPPCILHPTPYILHPTPYTLHPTPYTLHPTPPFCGMQHILTAISPPHFISSPDHPGGNPGAILKSISHRCRPILVAFVWELTKETIDLPLACLQGDLRTWLPMLRTRPRCLSLKACPSSSSSLLPSSLELSNAQVYEP